MKHILGSTLGLWSCAVLWGSNWVPPCAAEESVRIDSITLTTDRQQRILWSPYPAAEGYRLFSTTNLLSPMRENLSGSMLGFEWLGTAPRMQEFHRLEVTPLSTNALLTFNVLNRLSYGATPDDLDRVLTGPNAIGPQAYIEEQLSPATIDDDLDVRSAATNWIQRTATGVIAGTNFIVYLNGAGTVRLDDMTLVAGSEAEVGPNLLLNGDFEAPMLEPWIATSNYAGSYIDTSAAHGGERCLRLVGSARGSTSANGFYQPLPTVTRNTQVYTLSYWYLPEQDNENRELTVRLSGSFAESEHIVRPFPVPSLISPALENRTALLADLRAWFLMRAVGSKRQLLEIMLQFLENHFVTQHAKSYEYVDRYYDFTIRDQVATYLEYHEIQRWRQALLNPQCTFHDLLKISAESPAMILYLDTVASRGDRGRIANENYARELFELFCMGADNGYDQEDIVECSKGWTGWSIDIKDEEDIGDPFAPRSTTLLVPEALPTPGNLVGVWTFDYRSDRHNTNSKSLFPGKIVPARFGPPWAGRVYELLLPPRNGDESINDGYDIIQHLAELPFTAEFISVKLCRLFVHEAFEFGQYDYTDPTRSPEAELIRQCMMAWEEGDSKGQIWKVLGVIFNSDLFRGHAASMQKIKTPLEYAVSAVRSMRALRPDGTYTADTDGYSLAGATRTARGVPIPRMGSMFLFDRGEPDGYSELGDAWISAGTLAERIRFVQSFSIAAGQSGHNGGQSGLGNDAGDLTFCDPVAVLALKLAPLDLLDDEKVTTFLAGLLYPAEGRGTWLSSSLKRSHFSTPMTRDERAPFADLDRNSSDYDTRVRGALGMLMASPRFQEQ